MAWVRKRVEPEVEGCDYLLNLDISKIMIKKDMAAHEAT